MSLFLCTSTLQGSDQRDCSNLNISESIERECLSVLHKLHDQVNGLQLVQVVVQPLAKLFNPANLAALSASNVSQSPSGKNIAPNHTSSPQQQLHNTSGGQSSASNQSNLSQTPHCTADQDGFSSTNSSQHNHSRSQSFASSLGASVATGFTYNASSGNQASSNISSTSTYMMSPDTAQALIARLDTDRDVNWLMEIIGYGLSMPFSLTGEQDSVKDCCTIYCEWLSAALLPYDEHNEDSKYQQLSKLVPVPIRNDSNRYARKMLSHLYNVFLPRQHVPASTNSKSSSQKDETDAILTAVSRQAVLCHRVLRTIESIAHNRNNLMDNETWHHLLALLLTVNDKLLSPPTEPDDIGTQLHDRILGVLFDIMLLASAESIPDTSMWKTFHEMCLNWRHRPALVEHWRRITCLLTKRIVLLPPILTRNNIGFSDSIGMATDVDQQITMTSLSTLSAKTVNSSHNNPIESSISMMRYENLSHTWYRYLYLIGNPVELADPSVISRTDEFYHAACVANGVLDPKQHPCLNILPQIFLNSMIGLKEFIELFVGKYQQVNILSRRSSQADNQQQQVSQFKLNADRPKCNSILHIFGDWLFSAALIGSELNQEMDPSESQTDLDSCNISESMTSVGSSATATEVDPSNQNSSPAFRRKQSHQSTASSHTSTSTNRRRQSKQLDSIGLSSERIALEPPLTAESFESGQAEAMSTLCKIFSSKSHAEDITPAYLARFYLCIQHCLNFGRGQDARQSGQIGPIKRQLLASVLMNSITLLQKDLDGINLLIPSFIRAIEFVFECSEKELPVQPPPRQHSTRANSLRSGNIQSSQPSQNAGIDDLRRASTITLINLLAYPLHFQDLAIRSCLDGTSPITTFSSLRPRLLKLLFIAMQTETDPTNMQILFGGLSLAIHDLTSPSKASSSPNPKTTETNSRRSEYQPTRCDSMNSSLDPSQDKQAVDTDTISQSSFVFNSSDGFLIKSLHVTCHLLINIWKQDNLVSLAALEVLTTIARVSMKIDSGLMNNQKPNNNNMVEMKNEYMQTTRWICDYICNQCSRPPPAHSRDMHSTIVAAYQCLSVWFYEHPYLLKDKTCIDTVMEVIELGVSGQKSKTVSLNTTIGVVTSTTISKGEKSMKPSSLRVREAAESLLNICMVRTCHKGSRNIGSCDTIINETDITQMFGGSKLMVNARQIQDNQLCNYEAYKQFKYFSDEDSILIGVMDKMHNDASCKDTVICLIRTPFGKHCWKMKFNYYSERSREKIIANKTIGLIKRPFHQMTAPLIAQDAARMFSFSKGHSKPIHSNMNAKFFPPTIDNLPPNDLDLLVTTLDDYLQGDNSKTLTSDKRFKNDLDKLNKILAHQILVEQKVRSESVIRVRRNDCEEPQQVSDIRTARLIVAHLGLKNVITSLKTDQDGISSTFVNHIQSLDSQSIRTCDTVNIFYIRRNRTAVLDILESTRERHNVSLDFFEWLLSLGRPVIVRDHNRWTGKKYGSTYESNLRLANSLTAGEKPTLTEEEGSSMLTRNQMLNSDHGGAIFDGERMLLHWSDMCQEIAFIVPHKFEKIAGSRLMICWMECWDDIQNVPYETLLSLNQTHGNSAIVDAITSHDNFQTSQQQRQKQSKAQLDYAIYFICPMKNGLYKINLVITLGRQWFGLPLVDGMTVSKPILGSIMMDSILNLCRRKRLDADSYQPPHVKRRLMIQEICNNYKISTRSESSEFYQTLFREF